MSKELTRVERPTSKDLIRLVEENRVAEVKSIDTLKMFLNTEPPKQWIKEHPYARGIAYLPIDKVELLMDTIFQEWHPEIISISQLAQSIVCIVRVHYKNPVTGEWQFTDGTGAVPLKTDKGCSAADLSNIKSDAVQTGAPAAKSYAIKDAVEHLGKIFGRDLNRKDTVDFYGVYVNGERDTEKLPHKPGLDATYGKLMHESGRADIMDAIREAKKMPEREVRYRIENLEKEAIEIERSKSFEESKQETNERVRQAEIERFYDHMAGYD